MLRWNKLLVSGYVNPILVVFHGKRISSKPHVKNSIMYHIIPSNQMFTNAFACSHLCPTRNPLQNVHFHLFQKKFEDWNWAVRYWSNWSLSKTNAWCATYFTMRCSIFLDKIWNNIVQIKFLHYKLCEIKVPLSKQWLK